jgi:hypothetical protein
LVIKDNVGKKLRRYAFMPNGNLFKFGRNRSTRVEALEDGLLKST